MKLLHTIYGVKSTSGRSRWPCGASVAARLVELRVRTPPAAWMSVSGEYCLLSAVSVTGRSLVQRSLTECVCVCVCVTVIRCNNNLYTYSESIEKVRVRKKERNDERKSLQGKQ